MDEVQNAASEKFDAAKTAATAKAAEMQTEYSDEIAAAKAKVDAAKNAATEQLNKAKEAIDDKA
jgi:hypothetical protein